jgi:hypothetical protein
MTAEWPVARQCHRLGGICLVCDGVPARYRFDFLGRREAWILWLRDLPAAIALARVVANTTGGAGYIIRAEGLRHGR